MAICLYLFAVYDEIMATSKKYNKKLSGDFLAEARDTYVKSTPGANFTIVGYNATNNPSFLY
jgi:hypothetical protein